MQNTQDQPKVDQNMLNWGAQEFASADIGDARLNARLIAVAEAFMLHPGASVPKAASNWAGAKGVYRFFGNEKVNSQNILSPHTESTKRRIEGRNLVLAIQDTSTLDYGSRDANTDLGPAGNRYVRGLLLHPTLAVTPEGTPLGILDLQIWSRPEDKWNSELTSDERRKTPVEEKESMKWINSYRRISEIQKEMEDKVHFVSVCDREGDMYDLFLEHHKLSIENETPPDLLVRAAKDRKLAGDSGYLWDFMDSIEIFGEYDIQVPRKVGKKAREATLQIRFSKITMRRPNHRYNAQENPSFDLYAVYTCEKNPPGKEKGISWMLLTTMPVLNFEEAVEKVEWYTDRWMIETFFKILKSGCKIEERQMQTGSRLISCITVDSIIAWRILFLTFIGRELPDISADIIFEPHEWQSLHCRLNNTSELPDNVPSIYTVMIQIARLGGFLARKSDGFPGPVTVFRGMRVLNEMASVYKILRPADTCG